LLVGIVALGSFIVRNEPTIEGAYNWVLGTNPTKNLRPPIKRYLRDRSDIFPPSGFAGGEVMPKNDYDDPELTFPRLEARIRILDGETYWLQVWYHKEPGAPREVMINGKRAEMPKMLTSTC
jgi:hypothetical protein